MAHVADDRTVRGERRDEVIEAATRIFEEKGYEAASIQDVADELGILKGSLYHYIDSKEELLFTIIDDVHRRSLAELEQWLEMEADTLTRLRALIRLQVIGQCRDIRKASVFLHDFRSLSPQRQARILAERDRFDMLMRDVIKDGQRDGSIAAEVDAKLATMAIFGIVNWISQWWRADGERSPDEVADEYADLVLCGLVPPNDGRRRDIGRLPEDLTQPL